MEKDQHVYNEVLNTSQKGIKGKRAAFKYDSRKVQIGDERKAGADDGEMIAS